jgi:hypothetical protein
MMVKTIVPSGVECNRSKLPGYLLYRRSDFSGREPRIGLPPFCCHCFLVKGKNFCWCDFPLIRYLAVFESLDWNKTFVWVLGHTGMGMFTPAISSSRRWHPTFARTSRHSHVHCAMVRRCKFLDIGCSPIQNWGRSVDELGAEPVERLWSRWPVRLFISAA